MRKNSFGMNERGELPAYHHLNDNVHANAFS